MRTVYRTAVALLGAAPVAVGPAHGQATHTAAPAAVELRLSATGRSVKPADQVTIHVPVTGKGETAAAARAANRAAVAALREALAARGIGGDAVVLLAEPSRMGFPGNEVVLPDIGARTLPFPGAMREQKTDGSILRIRLVDLALVDSVREILDRQSQSMSTAPAYALADDRAARGEAIADAVRKARQDAESYAAALGLRVERITSVSSYGDATPGPPDPDFFLSLMTGGQVEAAGQVTTRVQVWVNFILMPR